MHAFKVILLGDAGVGKTQLITRYVTGVFHDGPQPTLGMACQQKIVSRPDAQVRLTLWDTAGAERHRALATSFYRETDGAVVVFDVSCRESLADVPSHVAQLRDVVPECPILICGNKTDAQATVERDAAKQLAASLGCGFYEASARTGDGIQLLFNSLVNLMIEQNAEALHCAETLRPTINLKLLQNEKDAAKKTGCC